MGSPDPIAFLKKELARWLEQGLISAEQRDRILLLYPEPSLAPEKRRVSSWLPVILIVMAVLLIGLGLILFYAANWRKMAPGLKLAQIIGLLVAIHGGSFALLFGRRPMPLAGRGLLVLGMIAFGAAIGLVAQTYHISAHPTHGVLLWLLGVTALSAVMRERIGYYLALLLALVWHGWEYGIYDNVNLGFPALLALLGVLLYRERDAAGLLAASLMGLLWVHLANARVGDTPGDATIVCQLFLQMPFGVVLITLQRLRKPAPLALASEVLGTIGWLAVFAPLMVLSWPSVAQVHHPFFEAGMGFLLAEHLGLSALAGGLLLALRRKGEPGLLVLGVLLLFGLLPPVLPLGSKAVLMLYTHLGLLGLVMILLVDSHRRPGLAVQRVIAFFCAISTLFVKAGGFLILGLMNSSYLVAYGLGALLVALLIFLVNRSVPPLLPSDPAPYRGKILEALTSLVAFLVLYALSFQVRAQSSIFSADPVVLLLVGVFVALALGLYLFLWRRSADRLPLILSAALFAAVVLMLLITSPSLPWQLYSFVFNLLMLAFEGLLLFHATRVNSIALANLVVIGFAGQLATRYFDIFWDLLSGSLLFIVTGCVVFAGGFLLERNRRRLVKHMRESR